MDLKLWWAELERHINVEVVAKWRNREFLRLAVSHVVSNRSGVLVGKNLGDAGPERGEC